MSLTISKVTSQPVPVGDRWMTVNSVQFDNNYLAGGLPLVGTDLGFASTVDPEFHVQPNMKSGYTVHYDHAAGKLQAYAESPGAEFAYAPGGGDVKGATVDSAVRQTTDQTTDVVNGALYVNYQSFTTINGAAGSFGTITTQPAFGRNLQVSIKNASAGNLNLYVGAMVITVVGTFRGAAQTEAITLTTLTGNKAVAHAPDYRSFQGLKPFDTITSASIDATSLASIIVSDGALQIGIGPGTLIGLPENTQTGTNADVLALSVNAVARTVAGNMDFTNQTFNVGTTADGDDLAITYKTQGEVLAGTNLSGVTCRVLAWGRFRG